MVHLAPKAGKEKENDNIDCTIRVLFDLIVGHRDNNRSNLGLAHGATTQTEGD